MERLVDALDDASVGLGLVVADGFPILLKRGVRLKAEHEERFRQYCVRAIERKVPLRSRYDLGLALGLLGDPRIVVDLRDPAAYFEIPAGTYRVGDEMRPFVVPTGFLLAKYPVTNGQFELFIQAGGYAMERWWPPEGWKWRTENGITEPRYWADSRFNALNKPVVGVSWYEAQAFANWTGGRLPGEYEWEAAARGPAGPKYPWGDAWNDGICNSLESALGNTSPVGLFPKSRSAAFGLEDMGGNVWQWCENLFESGLIRVIRGGSWYDPAESCRSAYRNRYVPGGRFDNLGFRVARSPSGGSGQ